MCIRDREPFDVTPVQYGVLYCLWKGDKTTPKEIAAELKLENSTISGILDRMEKKDLLKRQVSTEAVSYTHLDVYKRQLLYCSGCSGIF